MGNDGWQWASRRKDVCVNRVPAGWGIQEAGGKATSGTMVYFAPTRLGPKPDILEEVKCMYCSSPAFPALERVTMVIFLYPLHKAVPQAGFISCI